MRTDEVRHGIWSAGRDTDQRRTHGRRLQRLSMSSGSWRSITSVCGVRRSLWERRAVSASDYESRKNVPSGGGKAIEMFCAQIAYNYFQASWLLLRAVTSFFPGAFVAGTRGCTWFVRAPSNNCTISPTDKWISRGEVRTVGACIEGAGAVPFRPALIPGGRSPPRLIHYLSTKLFRPPVAHNNEYKRIEMSNCMS